MVLRFHLFAVAAVTVTVSVSSAGAGLRIARSPGSARYSAQLHLIGRGDRALGIELQQVAGVFRNEVDRVVPQCGHVGLPASDAELTADGEAVGRQRLGVDLRHDLGFGEVGRTDHHRFQVSGGRAAAERVGAAAAGEGSAAARAIATTARRTHDRLIRFLPAPLPDLIQTGNGPSSVGCFHSGRGQVKMT